VFRRDHSSGVADKVNRLKFGALLKFVHADLERLAILVKVSKEAVGEWTAIRLGLVIRKRVTNNLLPFSTYS
jgi:hypothetical protein